MALSIRETGNQKDGIFPILPDTPPPRLKCFLGLDSLRVRGLKKEIELTTEEVLSIRALVKDYGYTSQKWIQETIKLTRVRRSWLRAILFESGTDHFYCVEEFPSVRDAEFDSLHSAYHKVMS